MYRKKMTFVMLKRESHILLYRNDSWYDVRKFKWKVMYRKKMTFVMLKRESHMVTWEFIYIPFLSSTVCSIDIVRQETLFDNNPSR